METIRPSYNELEEEDDLHTLETEDTDEDEETQESSRPNIDSDITKKLEELCSLFKRKKPSQVEEEKIEMEPQQPKQESQANLSENQPSNPMAGQQLGRQNYADPQLQPYYGLLQDDWSQYQPHSAQIQVNAPSLFGFPNNMACPSVVPPPGFCTTNNNHSTTCPTNSEVLKAVSDNEDLLTKLKIENLILKEFVTRLAARLGELESKCIRQQTSEINVHQRLTCLELVATYLFNNSSRSEQVVCLYLIHQLNYIKSVEESLNAFKSVVEESQKTVDKLDERMVVYQRTVAPLISLFGKPCSGFETEGQCSEGAGLPTCTNCCRKFYTKKRLLEISCRPLSDVRPNIMPAKLYRVSTSGGCKTTNGGKQE